jgi:alkanesulfonate monooxygenase SsuD/methylene tetrahydromethanopterin reductase-like flavin-dependent oxidoreductase (luciferase family)
MRMGFILPGGPAPEQLEQAVLAEQAGWDGVFVWEAAYGVDAWTLLGAMAARTERINLGTLLTPLPWRRPWKVASQVATLDQLSNGRAIVTVGLGSLLIDLPRTDEVTDLRERADLMDEGIALVRALLTGSGEFRGATIGSSLSRTTSWTSPGQSRSACRSGSSVSGPARSPCAAYSFATASSLNTTAATGRLRTRGR